MDWNMIGVLGVGQMGRGIVQTVASSGLHVMMYDLDPHVLEDAQERITENLNKAVKKEKLTEWVREKTLKNIKATGKFEDLALCPLVIEAVPEKEEIKLEVFEGLDEICPKETIFASNTSSLPITRMASGTDRPEQFIGLHFMNPVPQMPLVEVTRGWQTSDDTFNKIEQFVKKLGKTMVVSKDYPGFIVNRILMPMINEAIFALIEGVGTVEDIDAAMKLGGGLPMGPFALADMIGLDVCLDVMEIIHSEFGDSKYRPAPLLRKYVEADMLGQKTGRGFYTYETK